MEGAGLTLYHDIDLAAQTLCFICTRSCRHGFIACWNSSTHFPTISSHWCPIYYLIHTVLYTFTVWKFQKIVSKLIISNSSIQNEQLFKITAGYVRLLKPVYFFLLSCWWICFWQVCLVRQSEIYRISSVLTHSQWRLLKIELWNCNADSSLPHSSLLQDHRFFYPQKFI